MSYSDIAKLAWSANYVFTDLQFKLQNAIDDELEMRGQEQTKGYFFEWPASISQEFFNLCMEVLFVSEEETESLARDGVERIILMILNERGSELLDAGGPVGRQLGEEPFPQGV